MNSQDQRILEAARLDARHLALLEEIETATQEERRALWRQVRRNRKAYRELRVHHTMRRLRRHLERAA